MKEASFNVNSLLARLEVVPGRLDKLAPDILCVQETKVQNVACVAPISSDFRGSIIF
jgi:exonuclease III